MGPMMHRNVRSTNGVSGVAERGRERSEPRRMVTLGNWYSERARALGGVLSPLFTRTAGTPLVLVRRDVSELVSGDGALDDDGRVDAVGDHHMDEVEGRVILMLVVLRAEILGMVLQETKLGPLT